MILNGDALHIPLKDKVVQTCVTSPPYFGLRDYGVDSQIGLEETPEAYVEKLVQVFREVWRVLKDDGTLWLNLGDSYATHGSARGKGQFGIDMRHDARKARSRKKIEAHKIGLKEKDLYGIPWRVAFALQADGWYLRSDIIWSKPNPMPESVKDRPTKAHEYIFLLSKNQKYYYDADAIREPQKPSSISRARYRLGGFEKGKEVEKTQQNALDGVGANKKTVWSIATRAYSGAHFATFPPKLIEPCILAGSREGDVVLDPFSGSGTTGQVAIQHRREYVGVELNWDYIGLSRKRTTTDVMLPMMEYLQKV